MKHFLLSAITLFIVSCATLPETEKKITQVYLDENNTLHYDGSLTLEANNKLFALFEKAHTKPTNLMITSNGGDVMLGLDLGEWVYDKRLDVTIGKGCASSCANYIFPAGKNKFLSKHSILIWHGNSYQEDVNQLVLEKSAYHIKWRKREDAFYKMINANPQIGVYGHKEFNFWNMLYHYFNETLGFDYSLEDMKKFGLNNITLLDGEWDWRKYNSSFNVLRVEVNEEDLF